ncbi:MAG: hypothetical protein ACFFAZ_16905 [Promethearchaeota archaeon]
MKSAYIIPANGITGTFFVDDGVDNVMEDRRKRTALFPCNIAVIIVAVFLTWFYEPIELARYWQLETLRDLCDS